MTRWILSFAILLSVAPAGAAPASAFDGTWYWQGNGGWQQLSLELKTSGNTVSGTLHMGPGGTEKEKPVEDWQLFFEPANFQIANGRISGSTISFEQTVIRGNGTLPAEVLRYSGTLEGDRISFSRESVQRPKDAFILGNHRMEFVAERTRTVPRTKTSRLSPKSTSSTTPPQRVTLIADVGSKNGTPVQNLVQADFQILEDGTPLPIQAFAQGGMPLNVLLLFDHSQTWINESVAQNASGYGVQEWNRLLKASTDFLSHLRRGDHMALAEFESGVQTALDWWTIQPAAPPGVAFKLRTPPSGQTDLYGTLNWAVSKFAGLEGRKIAVLFTDGRDGRLNPRWLRTAPDPRGVEVLDPLFGLHDVAESGEFDRLLQTVSQSGVQFFFIGINTDRDPEFGPSGVGRRLSGLFPGSSEAIDSYIENVRSRLNRIAAVSGGLVFYGDTPADGESIFSNLHRNMGIGSYSLAITPTHLGDGGNHRLELRMNDPELRAITSTGGYR